MTNTPGNTSLRLRGINGELAVKWLENIALAAKKGVPVVPLAWEDVERHPELYVVSPKFIDVEERAWTAPTLEIAQRYQLILRREGIETKIV
jgi:hypothetical protein